MRTLYFVHYNDTYLTRGELITSSQYDNHECAGRMEDYYRTLSSVLPEWVYPRESLYFELYYGHYWDLRMYETEE